MENTAALRELVETSTFNINELPENIEMEIADYLDEQCNSADIDSRLLNCKGPKSERVLTYIGEFQKFTKPIKYWSFPCDYKPGCWAVVHPFEKTYALGIELESPK